MTSVQEFDSLVKFYKNERDSITSYSRHPVYKKNSYLTSSQQLLGRIFSFLPSNAKKAVALTCKLFYEILVEEKSQRTQTLTKYIEDNYIVVDTNTDSALSLETKMQAGLVFCLTEIHAKAHRTTNETFMKIALTAESRIFTEGVPRGFTNDHQLLKHCTPWGIHQSPHREMEIKEIASSDHSAIIPLELLRFVQTSKSNHDYIDIGLTLYYLHLVSEEDCQKFIQKILHFYQIYEADRPKDWPKDAVLNAMATGKAKPEPKLFASIKTSFLNLLFHTCLGLRKRMTREHAKETVRYTLTDNSRNEDLAEKIFDCFVSKTSVIVEGGISHFFKNELSEKIDELESRTKTVVSMLSEKNIPYIVLYPIEPLISRKEITNSKIGTLEYCNAVQFYLTLDYKLAMEKGKNQEMGNLCQEQSLQKCFSNEKLEYEFLEFLTHPSKEKEGFPWQLAGRIVRANAYEAYTKDQVGRSR